MDMGGVKADYGLQEFVAEGSHVFKFLLPMRGVNEIFDLHLRAFTIAQDEIARTDLVAKSFAVLSEAKRQAGVKSVEDVFVVDEDALGGLGAEIGDVVLGGLGIVIRENRTDVS